MGVGAGLYMCDVVVKSSRSLSHLLMSSCLLGRCPSCHSPGSITEGSWKHWLQWVALSHPIFIHHQTPEGKWLWSIYAGSPLLVLCHSRWNCMDVCIRNCTIFCGTAWNLTWPYPRSDNQQIAILTSFDFIIVGGLIICRWSWSGPLKSYWYFDYYCWCVILYIYNFRLLVVKQSYKLHYCSQVWFFWWRGLSVIFCLLAPHRSNVIGPVKLCNFFVIFFL